jgi:exodeoxyribonuclease V gamma subunit
MLFVHRSNRAERLVEELGDTLAESPPGPFAPEPIIVQGRGMERWLSMELSRRFGVWANPSFPFPRRYLLELFERSLGADLQALSRFEPAALAWAIAARLPGHLGDAAFVPLARYLAREEGEARLLALAARVARTFDDYAVFRPDLIAAWQTRCDGTWQSILWRHLVADLGTVHVAAETERLIRRLRRGAIDGLPGRLSVFGVSTLAPRYLEAFAAIAAATDVHLFVLSPSREYWVDLRTRRELVRQWLDYDRRDDDAAVEEQLANEEGNRLLASLGRLGREFQAVLEATADYDDREAYDDPAGGDAASMLGALQSDMLHLVHRGAAAEVPRLAVAPGDDSIAVHSCHGPMREVQVLHDQLRDLFERDPSLRPRDVIVMTPEIETYAPFIEAVFEAGEIGPDIPYRIADRGPAATNTTFEAFREVLGVLRGRMTSAEVVDLLRLEPLRRRFELAEEEIEIVREWVERVAIRWGIDAAHRAEQGQLAIDQNTWAFGLRRLFLGYAMGDDEAADYADVAPYGDIEGDGADALGKLAEFCEKLFAAARRLERPQPIDQWPDAVKRLLDDLFAQDGPLAYEMAALRGAIDAVANRAREAGYTGDIGAAAIAGFIEEELRSGGAASGFLTGAVTFCEMVPMRAIPFGVVCLIGMNDGTFPRSDRRPDFDRIGQRRRCGDRSLRDDDRYMFLEALLSARRKFYVSFVGQSAHGRSLSPPSVVVQELLDAIDESFAPPEGCKRASEGRITIHPLQAFSPSYFKVGAEERLVSYSRPAFDGARALCGEVVPAPPFVTKPVAWEGPKVVALADFARFFENPSRAYAQHRLQVYLGRDADALATREPLDLKPLDRWQVGDDLLRRSLEGRPCDLAAMRRRGLLPAGEIGRAEYDGVGETVAAICGEIDRSRSTGETVDVELDFGDDRLNGTVADVDAAGRTEHQYSTVGGRQELSLWIRHLALCASRPEWRGTSTIVGRLKKGAAKVLFPPVDGARDLLAEMFDLYRLGMSEPLPLFVHASRAYAEELLLKKGTEAAAARKARIAFGPSSPFDAGQCDADDSYVRLLYGAESPFASDNADARRVARTVYERFFAMRSETKV